MAQNALILLATGRDRPGIVDRISGLLLECRCNLEDSRMAILGGEFALIVLITAAPGDLQRAEERLPRLAGELELTLQIKPTLAGPGARGGGPHAIRYRIRAVAMDHPGIVHRLTRILAESGVNVARLDTSISNAPVSGTPIFSIDLEAEVPASVPVSALRTRLIQAAETENIDLEMKAMGAG